MRGIPEDKAIEIGEQIDSCKYLECSVKEWLRDECQELNHCLPIDGNTPKDRRLNLYWKGYGWFTGQWRMGQYFCDAGLMVPVNIKPTHYQELPDDPEPGDKNG